MGDVRTKDEIRAVIREKRGSLDAFWVNDNSGLIERQVEELIEFRKASIVAAYVAMQGEVRTDAVIEQCWQKNKRVCVPAYRAETNHYDFVRLNRDARMVVGPAQILEPEEKQWIRADEVGLALVPGVAFDSLGGRVGHGGGHYDRILGGAKVGMPFTVGLAFEFQIFDRVPTDASDVRMDVVVTEKRVIRAQSAEGAR